MDHPIIMHIDQMLVLSLTPLIVQLIILFYQCVISVLLQILLTAHVLLNILLSMPLVPKVREREKERERERESDPNFVFSLKL